MSIQHMDGPVAEAGRPRRPWGAALAQRWLGGALVVAMGLAMIGPAQAAEVLEPIDVFDLEWVSDPQIRPDGEQIVYVRNGYDIMSDSTRSNLWLTDVTGARQRPLTTGNARDVSPRWSPDGKRLLYVSSREGGAELWLRWMDEGHTAKLTNLRASPGNVAWSPDGQWIAFTMFVERSAERFAAMPAAPEGARWAPPAKVITRLRYRADGPGYLDHGNTHLFVVPASGGTPRRLTEGDFNHGGPLAWSADGSQVYFSANRRDDWDMEPGDTDLYAIRLADRGLTRLTERHGPDNGPVVSPDGKRIAWLGYDQRYLGYQVTRLHVMDADGSNRRVVSAGLDRDVRDPQWKADGSGLYFRYDDLGGTQVALINLDGTVSDIVDQVGGLSLGRPYTAGAFSVAKNGRIAYTLGDGDHPADLGTVLARPGRARRDDEGNLAPGARLTTVNADLLDHKQLGEVEMFWYRSSHDGRKIQGWIVRPPNFDPKQRYPLILEIHGGPFTAYSGFFSTEVQLYAAAGYVVLYTNPRGSTSYGAEFGNEIHHAYPSHDYDDLMSGVDAVIERGYVDPEQLFVTGGSGGGVLTSWIVGHTDRFAAAVSAKPVINWYSFVLTADIPTVYKSWFPGLPWDHLDHYMQRSPIQHVGRVKTPTMLLTGEVDYRTPMSETEQYYTALKLRGIDTTMVRIQQASHGIAAKPSNLVRKVVHILEWFERYRTAGEPAE